MTLPMMGSPEKLETSKYQVMLTDESDKSIPPLKRTRTNRFFDDKESRNAFVNALESSIRKSGGKLVHDKLGSHPLFVSFDIYDSSGNQDYSLTVYH